MKKSTASQSDKLLNKLFGNLLKNIDAEKKGINTLTLKELLSSLATWGGKNKDDLIQLLCREIGVATAAVLKEPLNQIIHDKKLQITIELLPRGGYKIETKPTGKQTKSKSKHIK